jgi:amino acid adenylation domain-containing protein
MKTTTQVLADFRQLRIELWVEGDVLRYQAPKGTITPDLLSELRERKPEIIDLLKHESGRGNNTIVPMPRTADAVLSFAQQRLWFLNELEGENATYNIFMGLRLKGNLDRDALTKALQIIVERHETLSTSFGNNNGAPIQIIKPNLKLDLPIVDLESLLDDRQRSERATCLAKEEAQQPFNLAISPLFRAKLLKLSDTSHELFLNLHHTISDGWSMGILKNELSILYQDFRAGRSPSLAPLPIQYIDFARWQRDWLQEEVLARQVNYWKNQLANIPPVLNLPTDKPRPAIQTFIGKQHQIQLSSELTQKLKQLSQKLGATLFMSVLTAFSMLLSRYSHQLDVVIGSPIANRNRQEIESLIGLFANTLALRIDLQHNPSFQELLTKVREVCLDAYSHQDLPIEKLVEELQPERSLSHNPIFQTVFSLENIPNPIIELTDLNITQFAIDPQTSKFDLTLALVETPAGLSGYWEYNTDLFEDATIERMSGNFQTLLEGIVADSTQSITQLPLLTVLEQQQLLIDWNDTKVVYTDDKCIHQLFEAQVTRTPTQIAVVFEGKELTYQELDRQANQLAHHLKLLGVNPEVLVGICVDRSLDLIVGLLGILKAGGAYIPLDPAYPAERLTFMLQDSQISTLLTQQHLLLNLPAHPAQVICLDRDWESIATHPQNSPESNTNPDNLIYTIYTSGSTGKPKGVQIIHRNVVNFLIGMQQHLQLTDLDHLLSVTSISFDILGLEIFLPLTLGAKVILASREVASDGFQLLAQLNDSNPTLMQATPATWRMLIAAGWTGNNQLKVLCGGEALPQNLADQLCQSNAEVWNLYGPTETTIWSTIDLVRSPESLVTIGRPITNTQIYILDEYLQPVPVGVHGELHIGGDGLARGYFDRSELTTEKFIPNPFSTDPLSRLYKTGDLARYLSDGKIEYLGRIDNQVKIRGFRIELGEIETVLRKHPVIQQSVVNITVDDSGEDRLVVYIIAHPEQTITTEELRRFLKQELPDYMVPSVFIFLETLPLTPNGKIDRCALPPPNATRFDLDNTYVSPRDELELQLTKVWERTLGVHPIGMEDNFFDLGGNSLLSVKLIAEIKQAFDKNLSVVTLFQAQTIEQLAIVLREEKWAAAWNSLVPIQSGGAKPPLFIIHPCSGEVVLYRLLAKYLGRDRPIYGLQAIGLDGVQTPHNCVEQMVTHYLQEIKSIQPQGPYFLGGKHIGACVAIEIGRELINQGHQVELVVLFSGFIEPRPVRRFSQEWNARQFKKLTQTGPSYLLQRFQEMCFRKILNINSPLFLIIQKLSHYFPSIQNFFQSSSSALDPIREKITFSLNLALANYTRQSYPGRVVIFQPIEEYNGEFSELDRKQRLICHQLFGENFELYDVPGAEVPDFTAYKEPHVQILAEKLRICLGHPHQQD